MCVLLLLLLCSCRAMMCWLGVIVYNVRVVDAAQTFFFPCRNALTIIYIYIYNFIVAGRTWNTQPTRCSRLQLASFSFFFALADYFCPEFCLDFRPRFLSCFFVFMCFFCLFFPCVRLPDCLCFVLSSWLFFCARLVLYITPIAHRFSFSPPSPPIAPSPSPSCRVGDVMP